MFRCWAFFEEVFFTYLAINNSPLPSLFLKCLSSNEINAGISGHSLVIIASDLVFKRSFNAVTVFNLLSRNRRTIKLLSLGF